VEGLHAVGVLFTKDKCLLCVNLCVMLIFIQLFLWVFLYMLYLYIERKHISSYVGLFIYCNTSLDCGGHIILCGGRIFLYKPSYLEGG
jgi:hypothetical protein